MAHVKKSLKIKINKRSSLEIQWLGSSIFSAMAWVQSLVREQRFQSYVVQPPQKIPGDIPGDPVVEARSFHCRGLGFHPWWGNQDPSCHSTKQTSVLPCCKLNKNQIKNKQKSGYSAVMNQENAGD